MSKAKPYADLKAKVRTYTDNEGKEKGVYIKVGTLFASDNLNNMFIVIEAIPLGKEFDGIVSVFKREEEKKDEFDQTSDDSFDGVDL